MIYLHPVVPEKYAEYWHPSFGMLNTPHLSFGRDRISGQWALDNGCFTSWNAYAFVKALQYHQGLPECLFVVSPDVVGNHEKTLHRFWIWQSVIRSYGYPVAFVAQNGLVSPDDIPFDAIDCLFIGGDTQFKLSALVTKCVREAKQRGKWVHMGRVNTLTRLRHANSIGCDSVDGTRILFERQFITKFPAYLQSKQERLWD